MEYENYLALFCVNIIIKIKVITILFLGQIIDLKPVTSSHCRKWPDVEQLSV